MRYARVSYTRMLFLCVFGFTIVLTAKTLQFAFRELYDVYAATVIQTKWANAAGHFWNDGRERLSQPAFI